MAVKAEGRMQETGLSWLVCMVFTLSVVLAMTLTGCTPIYSNHGYIPTDDDLGLLVVGADSRESVAATIGRPAASGLLGDEAWYYIQSRYKTVAAAAPVEIDREVVAITFAENGLVANIERFGLDQGRIVPLSRRVTTANIRGRGILAQIFGNIGKLNTDNLFK